MAEANIILSWISCLLKMPLENYLHKLPHTAKIFSTHLESLEAFAIRKVKFG